jgi:dTDP-4-amino-4,6-dideoxy-D-glucose ammonia-lyase
MIIEKWLENPTAEINDDIRSFFLNIFLIEKVNNLNFIKNYLDVIIEIIYIFSNDPLETQKNIIKKFKINVTQLIEINKVISQSKIIQNTITTKGSGKKYWNTIIPFARYTSNVINNIYNFPLRIAFFPGVSCMFYCGFCGRNQNAKYPSSSSKIGIEKLKSVINEIDGNTAISISGGLEPLTNPYLGDLITYAKSKNLQVPLITNAYSLTEGYLEKNKGIWDLDSLRISLYGVDEESYEFVTRSKKSYNMVKNNTTNFLKKRKVFNSQLKVGFNYIILKENIRDIRKLCNYIEIINSESESKIDFLTLREDFGSVTGHDLNVDRERKYRLDGFLNVDDRKYLLDELLYVEEFKKNKFPNIHIDYGYALQGLLDKKLDYYLVRATDLQVTTKGYPQLSVAIDLFGDVFLYREAGFLNREGNEPYIIGRLEENNSLENIIKNHLKNHEEKTEKNSSRFLDSFDHLITKLLWQAKEDDDVGISFQHGPILERSKISKIKLGNNWYN